MKFIVVCFLLTVPVTLGLSGLLEMSQVLWTKLLNGGLSNIGPLDPLRVPIVKVDQSQGRINYRMVLTNIEILGLNDSSLESIHVGRGSIKSNLSEHEAGYVSYNDRNTIDYIRYRFHTVVKEPNSNQSHSEDLTVEPLEKYQDADAARVGDGPDGLETERRSNKYQENQQKYSVEDSNRRYASNHQQEQPNQYYQRPQQHQHEQSQGQGDFIPRRESNQHQDTQQHRNINDDYNRRYANVHHDGQQNQQRNNNDDYNRGHVNIYQEGQRNQYQQRPQQHQYNRGQDDSVPHRDSFASQVNTQRPHKRITYDENNYEKHQQIPRIEGFKSTTGTRHLDRDSDDGNHGERSYLIYAQTQNDGNNGNRRNNYPRSRENYEQMQSGHNVDARKDVEVQQMNGRVEIKYPARLSNNDKPCADMKDDGDVEVISTGQLSGDRRGQGSSSMRLENQPGYIDIVYADENSKKMRHFGNVHVEPRGDKTVYSLEDIRRDLENHRRFIIHNFTESELLSKKNDKVRTAEETKRIKDMVRYAKEFQENQGFFEEGMELIYHYGNGSETKVYDGKRMKREHVHEMENDDNIMHVIIKIRVPLLRVKADYVLMGKVGDQVLRGNGELNGNFTELIGDFTVELKKSSNNTLMVRAARARLVATDQNIELEGMNEKGPVNEILTQGLMAAEAVAAMLADDLATKALNESTTDAIIYKMYKELPTN